MTIPDVILARERMFGRMQISNEMNPSEDSQTKGPEAPASPGFLEWWKDTVAMLRPHVLDRLRIVDLAEPEQTMQGIERDTEERSRQERDREEEQIGISLVVIMIDVDSSL